jgi:hypothetical protein
MQKTEIHKIHTGKHKSNGYGTYRIMQNFRFSLNPYVFTEGFSLDSLTSLVIT